MRNLFGLLLALCLLFPATAQLPGPAPGGGDTSNQPATLTNKTIDGDLNTITDLANSAIKTGAAIDATKIANGSVSSTEFQYLDGVTSAVQTQISSKKVAQIVTTITNSVISSNLSIPFDDTPPQSGEGTEAYTVTITPQSASSTLIVEVFGSAGSTSNIYMRGAVFRDSAASAFGGISPRITGDVRPYYGMWAVSSGSTSTTTFKFRIGTDGVATLYLNGFTNGSLLYGSGIYSGIRVTEVLP